MNTLPILMILVASGPSAAPQSVKSPTPLELLAAHPTPTNTKSELQMQAKLIFRNEIPFLSISLTNISARNLSIERQRLPWNYIENIRIAAVTESGEVVPNFITIDDTSLEGFLLLKPGQSVSGDYPLYQQMNWRLIPKGKRVFVLWACEVPVLDQGKAHFNGFQVMLPKK